jgi:hypothetical protein
LKSRRCDVRQWIGFTEVGLVNCITRAEWLVLLVLLVLWASLSSPIGLIHAQAAEARASPVRNLPETVVPGETFIATITFITPVDDFTTFGITDRVPEGWIVAVNEGWCSPPAFASRAAANTAEYVWAETLASGTSITIIYHITVPAKTQVGIYHFGGELEYYIGAGGPYVVSIGGDSQLEVAASSASPPSVAPPTESAQEVFTIVPGGLTGEDGLLVNNQGIAQSSITLITDDTQVQLAVAGGTRLLDSNGRALQTLTAHRLSETPPAPPQGKIVSAYDLGPEGAVFDPAIQITMNYDPALLSAGTVES